MSIEAVGKFRPGIQLRCMQERSGSCRVRGSPARDWRVYTRIARREICFAGSDRHAGSWSKGRDAVGEKRENGGTLEQTW